MNTDTGALAFAVLCVCGGHWPPACSRPSSSRRSVLIWLLTPLSWVRPRGLRGACWLSLRWVYEYSEECRAPALTIYRVVCRKSRDPHSKPRD